MKKLLLLLLTVPTVIWADEGKTVKFPAYCFTYAEFLKKVEFFEEVPLMVGLREQVLKNEDPVLVSVLYNKEEDTFSVVQFNKEVGCFIAAGTNLKFNMRGLESKDLK